MSPAPPLSPELSAQTPAEVLRHIEQLRADNEQLRAEKARLETLVAQLRESAGAPDLEALTPFSRAKKRKSRTRRKLTRLLGIILLLALALGGGALVAWALTYFVLVGTNVLN